MKRYVIATAIILFFAAVSFGLYEFFRQNAHIKDEKPGVVITAVDLVNQFEKDTAAANKNFSGKLVLAGGIVSKIDNSSTPAVIFLQAAKQMSSVKCFMDSIYKAEYKSVKVGDSINIKGICIGGEILDFGLGTDVTLKRCVLTH